MSGSGAPVGPSRRRKRTDGRVDPLAAVALAIVVAAGCGAGGGESTPLFGGPVTHPFEGVADVRQHGELLIFEDCLIVNGSSIYLSSGYSVIGPVDRAVVVDPSGRKVASSGDLIFIDGSTIEGDGGIPCDPERNITTALIAGALGTCTPEECDDAP